MYSTVCVYPLHTIFHLQASRVGCTHCMAWHCAVCASARHALTVMYNATSTTRVQCECASRRFISSVSSHLISSHVSRRAAPLRIARLCFLSSPLDSSSNSRWPIRSDPLVCHCISPLIPIPDCVALSIDSISLCLCLCLCQIAEAFSSPPIRTRIRRPLLSCPVLSPIDDLT